MKLAAPKNSNYAATVVRINNVIELVGLDNLVGVPVLGYQALTTRGIEAGELALVFTAETQLSEDYAHENQLYRDKTLNKGYNPHSWEGTSGYLDANRRIRAIKLRGHRSSALLMPPSSLDYTGAKWWELKEGDTFDSINGHDICQKYLIPVKRGSNATQKLNKQFKRVDVNVFREHIDTDNFWRNKHLLKPGQEVVVTQKLHGTSIRVGNVPVLRQKGRVEKFLNRWLPTADHEFDVVYGSRKVIKDANNPNQNHYYKEDIWTQYGKQIAELIPEGYMVYGELVGWASNDTPIQKNYSYHLPVGKAELYVYRVENVNQNGDHSDLSWDGVKQFCQARGLKWTPELYRVKPWELDEWYVDALMNKRYHEEFTGNGVTDALLPLSDKKTVDEGIVIRQEGLVPVLLKAKSPVFLEHETKLLDKGESDIESQEAA